MGELREEVVQANQLRKQQLVELGLLREEEKQRMSREHEAQVQALLFIAFTRLSCDFKVTMTYKRPKVAMTKINVKIYTIKANLLEHKPLYEINVFLQKYSKLSYVLKLQKIFVDQMARSKSQSEQSRLDLEKKNSLDMEHMLEKVRVSISVRLELRVLASA